MQTILDKSTRDALINRINTVNETNKPQWGKMNVYQMLKHCRLSEEMFSGKLVCKRMFIGRLLGRIALKGSSKDEKPMMRNAMTSPELIVKETTGDLLSERNKCIALIEEHENFSTHNFIHPFFGKMTKEQIGILAYKHIDHHLRQFNA